MACIKAEELGQIVELQVKRLARRLADKKIGLELDGAALDWLAAVGYDPVYGARPLNRALQRELKAAIAKAILAGAFPTGSTIAVDMEEERLRFMQAAEGHPGASVGLTQTAAGAAEIVGFWNLLQAPYFATRMPDSARSSTTILTRPPQSREPHLPIFLTHSVKVADKGISRVAAFKTIFGH